MLAWKKGRPGKIDPKTVLGLMVDEAINSIRVSHMEALLVESWK